MASSFSDYSVVSIVNVGHKGCECYSVQSKNSGKQYLWQPVNVIPSSDPKIRNVLMKEIQKLIDVNCNYLVKCLSYVEHEGTGTLYLVKEPISGNIAALIRKCKSTNSFIDETFIWKIVYQVACGAQAMHTRGPVSAHLDITAKGVHLNDEGDVKLDYWFTLQEEDVRTSNSEIHGIQQRPTRSDIHDLGFLMYQMSSLETSSPPGRIPPHYSPQLKSLVDLLTSDNASQRPTIETVLYHPAVVSHVVSTSLQKLSIQTEATSNSVCQNCKIYEERKAALKRKELRLKTKEHDLIEKEIVLAHKEKHICLKEKLLEEKLSAVDERMCMKESKVKNNIPNELDSSGYSADTGHYTMIQTVAKMDPTAIRRPASFASGSGSSSKSVRFEPILETQQQPLQAKNDCQLWLRNKRAKYKTNNNTRWKTMKAAAGKENLIARKNASLTSLPHSTKASSNGLLETFFR